MPCRRVPSRSSLPWLATNLAITSTSDISFHLILSHQRAADGSPLLLRRGLNQRQVCCRIKVLLHGYGINGEHHLQCWRYICRENMAALRCSVRVSHYHVRVDDRFSLIECDVTAHPDHFVLADNRNFLVHLALRIKPRQSRSTYGPDGREVRAGNVILLGELQQPGEGLISLIEDDRILLGFFSRVQQLNLHFGRFASGNRFRWGDVFACVLLGKSRDGGETQQ